MTYWNKYQPKLPSQRSESGVRKKRKKRWQCVSVWENGSAVRRSVLFADSHGPRRLNLVEIYGGADFCWNTRRWFHWISFLYFLCLCRLVPQPKKESGVKIAAEPFSRVSQSRVWRMMLKGATSKTDVSSTESLSCNNPFGLSACVLSILCGHPNCRNTGRKENCMLMLLNNVLPQLQSFRVIQETGGRVIYIVASQPCDILNF